MIIFGMIGGGGVRVPLGNIQVSSNTINPQNASVTLNFNADGTITFSRAGLGTYTGPSSWYLGAPSQGIGGLFYVKLVQTSGTTPTSGTLNTWLSLSTNRSWGLFRSAFGSAQFVGTIYISSTPDDSGIITSGTVTFNLFKDSGQ